MKAGGSSKPPGIGFFVCIPRISTRPMGKTNISKGETEGGFRDVGSKAAARGK